ncbi:uncharacterized protein Gasu_37080 [Galdieria sulphuraria]|uniref:Uncharacterized protein n=1 Tax=Galdieria sulphuraria TaxID=130081 RepID=M2XFM7_GALSU|nr:uncharacterized protein Gasu_37080 [Galdieria sulphuraria]EME28817.1 hypothetical protein Gasu_37080 [Galdieria sulphuraria]|eukprot:XP_005705337.1 hypothetical protein Gasu_37080 [Galdieria sulphuraria]
MAAQPRQEYRLDQRLRKRRRSNFDKPNLAWKRGKGNEDGRPTVAFSAERNENCRKATAHHNELACQPSLPSNSKQENILRYFTQYSGSNMDEVASADNSGERSRHWETTEHEGVVTDASWDYVRLQTSEESFFDGASVSSLLNSPLEEPYEEDDIEDDEPLCPVAQERRISFGISADTLLQQVYDVYGR